MRPPASRSRVVDRTANHAIGVYDDLVIMYTFAGSVDDPRHVFVGGELVASESKRTGAPVRALIVFPREPRPPLAALREAWKKVVPVCSPHIARLAVVVQGQGFGAAIQRAAVGGLSMLFSAKVPAAVVADVRAAFSHLGVAAGSTDAVVRFCERDLLG